MMKFGSDLDKEETALNEKLTNLKKKRFSDWLDQPLAKAMISMIPEGPVPDHVKLILQAAYEAGFDSGYASMAVEILTRVPKK
jgi:hypothetical protein